MTGSDAGHATVSLPAGHSMVCSTPLPLTVSWIADSASGRHRLSLVALTTHNLPLCVTSRFHGLGFSLLRVTSQRANLWD
ncbi:MAG: hypothetical protein WKF52_06855 [Sphingomicrobium sp.]